MEETPKSLKKHKCPNCDWKFSELGKYNRHVESSKKFDKPKKCAICNFSSCTTRGLANHKCKKSQKPILKKPTKFSCSKCDWKFSSIANFRRHMKRSKKYDKPQKCAFCNFSSCTPSGLGQHKCLKYHKKNTEITKKNVSCLNCDQMFYILWVFVTN